MRLHSLGVEFGEVTNGRGGASTLRQSPRGSGHFEQGSWREQLGSAPKGGETLT